MLKISNCGWRKYSLSTPNGGHKRYRAVVRDDILINGDLAVDEDENIGEVGIQSGVGGDNLLFEVGDGTVRGDLHADRIHPGFVFQVGEKPYINNWLFIH